jgi:hypothetical protein
VHEKYSTRRKASDLVGLFSSKVLGLGVGDSASDFVLRDGYHMIRLDRQAVAASFAAEAPPLMDRLLADLGPLADELGAAILKRDGPYIAAVGELSWLLAQSGYCYAACQITSRRKQYVLAQPVYTYLRNIDSKPLSMRVLKLPVSFESLTQLDFAEAERLELQPGASRMVNGFEEMIWFEESGIAICSVTTLPLGAYEATYDAQSGARVGLFSTEMRLSAVEVVLRMLGSAAWPGALDIARDSSVHAVRELRWAALNYVWRCDAPDLADWLETFAQDRDPQIAALARSCLGQIAVDEAAA